jgi:hypothetical protein
MTQALSIAKTIQAQIGHMTLCSLGAEKHLALGEKQGQLGGLNFKASLFGTKPCQVEVILTPQDLYNVTVYRLGKAGRVILSQEQDLYAEDLQGAVVEFVEKRFAGKK